MAIKKETSQEKVCTCKGELKKVLMEKLPGVFDREPAPAYNGNLDKLIDEIIEIVK